MSIVTFEDVHKSFGPEVVFDRLRLQFFAGQKVGLIGPNGSGKTTLFRLILGDEQPDMGKVACAGDLRTGYLPQESLYNTEQTVLEQMHEGIADILRLNRRIESLASEMETLSGKELTDAMAEYDRLCHNFETAGGYVFEARIKSILAGLDIGPEYHHAKISDLSGGQLSRLGLAKVLVKETNLLLLDEPTNHLDLQAVTWLESFLKAYAGTVILISHDRYLLDSICEKIIELENHSARVWKGNYSQYLETKKNVELARQRQHQKRAETVAKTLDFIARNKDREGMRKTARGRKKRLQRLLKENPNYLNMRSETKTIRFRFADSQAKSSLVLRAENVKKSFGELTLFDNLSFDVNAGGCLGITGPNGTGKTTLLKMAMGELAPDAGTIRLGSSLKVGYLDQQALTLDPLKSVLEEAQSTDRQLLPEQVRGKLGAFLFQGDDVFKKTGDLSGGQQNRLMLCKLVLSRPDVLILDEPTNHLDISSREMLEEALLEYDGSIIAVSHDRYFLDRIADQLLVIGAGPDGRRQTAAADYIPQPRPDTDGVFTTYVMKIQKIRAEREHQKIENSKKQCHNPAQQKTNRTPKHLTKFNKYSIEQLEEMIFTQEAVIEQMQQNFGDEKIYQEPTQLTQLKADFDSEKQQLALLYEAWEYRHK